MKKISDADKEWNACLRWTRTFNAFAHSILDNCDVPPGTVRERIKIAELKYSGMVSFWKWSLAHGNA